MASPPTMDFSATVTSAIQSAIFLSDHLDKLGNCKRTLQDAVKKLEESSESLQHTTNYFLHSNDETDAEYNIRIQLQLITTHLDQLSSPGGGLEGLELVAQQFSAICERANKYVGSLTGSESLSPQTRTQDLASNAASTTAITDRPGSKEKLIHRLGTLEAGTVVAKDGANQTIVDTSGGQFRVGNVRSSGSHQLIGPIQGDMKGLIHSHYNR